MYTSRCCDPDSSSQAIGEESKFRPDHWFKCVEGRLDRHTVNALMKSRPTDKSSMEAITAHNAKVQKIIEGKKKRKFFCSSMTYRV